MDFGLIITTLIVFAVLLAAAAGVLAARVLTHAARPGSTERGEAHDR